MKKNRNKLLAIIVGCFVWWAIWHFGIKPYMDDYYSDPCSNPPQSEALYSAPNDLKEVWQIFNFRVENGVSPLGGKTPGGLRGSYALFDTVTNRPYEDTGTFCDDSCTFWYSKGQDEISKQLVGLRHTTPLFKGRLYTECIGPNSDGWRPNWDDVVYLGTGTFKDVTVNGVQQCAD